MRGHCDNRALKVVFALVFAASAAGIAVMWPSLAMQLKTTEPVVWQALLAVAGSLLAASFAALLIALAAGVGFWAARTTPNVPAAGAAPAVGGRGCRRVSCRRCGRAGRQLRPSRDSPLAFVSGSSPRRWPWVAAALSGLSTVSSIAIGLFVLHMLERVTAAWTRRSWLAGAAVVALITGLVALKAGAAGAALAEGVAAGLVATAVVYFVLRFDARTVPGYLVAAALIDAAETAVVTGHPDGWTEFALFAVVGVAVGIVATRYLGRLAPHDAAPPFAAAQPHSSSQRVETTPES